GKIPDIIRASFREVNEKVDAAHRLVYEIIRMDEFLCLTSIPHSALHSMMLLASEFRHRSYKELNIRTELRLSLGIGPAELFQNELRESDGTAFRYADNGLQTMKRNQRLVITSGNREMDDEFQVACGFMDILIHDWSDDQAEAVFHSLIGKNQVEISETLNISQPAVNRRLKAAHVEAVERFITRYAALLGKKND
ncbi:MAG: SatD family protein, partial [Bacteroidales bacterium]|nr:SatD family protein [Bacteroidales bacterium]